MERFNIKKLNELEDTEQYRVEISNRFAALENLDIDVDINLLKPNGYICTTDFNILKL
jgi:hypothetical protein